MEFIVYLLTNLLACLPIGAFKIFESEQWQIFWFNLKNYSTITGKRERERERETKRERQRERDKERERQRERETKERQTEDKDWKWKDGFEIEANVCRSMRLS